MPDPAPSRSQAPPPGSAAPVAFPALAASCQRQAASRPRPLRILITSDAVGGVGTHAAALARALQHRGHTVRLLVCGPSATAPPGVDAEMVPGRLEWMGEGEGRALATEIAQAQAAVASLAHRWRPDVFHSNQFAFVGAAPATPTLLAVHSDVFSWWRTVRGQPPPNDAYHSWYRGVVQRALTQAAAVVAPTHSVLADLRSSFGFVGGSVLPHGCPSDHRPAAAKQPWAVSLGRLWDEGKQIELLCRSSLALPVFVAGDDRHPLRGQYLLPAAAGVRFLGTLASADVALLLAQASVYIAPSRYEPFGLAPLEAAHAGCALLLNDLPSFREVWGSAACYFARNDGDALARCLQTLASDSGQVRALAAAAAQRARQRYTAERMAADYEILYRRLL